MLFRERFEREVVIEDARSWIEDRIEAEVRLCLSFRWSAVNSECSFWYFEAESVDSRF